MNVMAGTPVTILGLGVTLTIKSMHWDYRAEEQKNLTSLMTSESRELPWTWCLQVGWYERAILVWVLCYEHLNRISTVNAWVVPGVL